MRQFLVLFLSFASCFASPFHSGASWEWSIRKVWCGSPNGSFSYACTEDAPTMLSATVIDSAWNADHSTYLWTIRFVDSALAFQTRLLIDTAILEEDTNRGKAKWIRGTVLFPIEPRAKDSPQETGASMDSSYAWGEGWRAGITDSTGELVWAEHVLQMGDARMNDGLGSGSLLRWDSRLGWIAGLAGQVRWHLVRKDGEAFTEASAAKPWVVAVPSKGTTFLWEVKRDSNFYDNSHDPNAAVRSIKTTSTGTVRWTFLEALPDSLSWIRATVEEIRSQGGKDSISTLSLRWDRQSRRSIPTPENGFCGDLVSDFWGREYMPEVEGFREQADSISFLQVAEHSIKSFVRARRAGGGDSSACWHGFRGQMGWYASGSDRMTYRLLQVDDSVIRQPSPVAVRARPRAFSLHGDLGVLASRFPALEVTVRDVRGSSRTLRLGQLRDHAAVRAFGPKFWETRLPDGSVQRGSFAR